MSLSSLQRWSAAFLLLAASAAHAQAEPERTGGPYVPTPQVVVDQMLSVANIGASDFVLDLGAGDGVIVLTAAERYKARGLGVEIDPKLVAYANGEAARRGIADRANFQVLDVFKADVSRASVITLYLLPGMMINLRPKIYAEAKPGTRIVSHDYHFDEWRADDSISFDVPEKEKVNGVPRATVYLWIVPAKIAGRWAVEMEGGEKLDLALRQTWQVIDGTAQGKNGRVKLQDTQLRGENVRFAFVNHGRRVVFEGTVTADGMKGVVDLGGGKKARWTATRAANAATASVQ